MFGVSNVKYLTFGTLFFFFFRKKFGTLGASALEIFVVSMFSYLLNIKSS